MKKTLYITAIIIFSVIIFSSCSYGIKEIIYRKAPSVEERAKELSTIDSEMDFSQKDKYTFLVISDVHYGAKKASIENKFLDFLSNLPELPDFCICLGDIAEHGLEEEYITYNEKLIQPLEELGIKTYNTVGNHDLYNSGWYNYIKYNYPYTSFYKFEIDGLSYYFLDSASCNLSKPQINQLKSAFEDDNNPKFAFTHVGLYSDDTTYFIMQDSQERNELISLFEKNNMKLFVCGHIHYYAETKFDNMQEINIPAFLDQEGWTLFTVDKTDNTYTYKNWIYGVEQ